MDTSRQQDERRRFLNSPLGEQTRVRPQKSKAYAWRGRDADGSSWSGLVTLSPHELAKFVRAKWRAGWDSLTVTDRATGDICAKVEPLGPGALTRVWWAES